MTDEDVPLSCREVTVAVPGRTLVEALSLELAAGEFLAILGRNGSGKTLTLHTLAGLRAPAAGEVRLRAQRIDALPRRAVARELALLPQTSEDMFPATVQETVLTGRHPHIATFGRESVEDRRIAREALERVSLAGFATRDVGTLSGGERRRVDVAQVLAQAPSIYLLDEPTNHLDLDMREALAMALQEFAGAMVVVSHDRHLLRVTTDRLLLVNDGRVTDFEGSLDDYPAWLAGRERRGVPAPEEGVRSAAADRERRRIDAQRRQRIAPWRRRVADAEAALERLEVRRQTIEQRLADPALYEGEQRDALLALLAEQADIEREREQGEAEWLAAAEALERAREPLPDP